MSTTLEPPSDDLERVVARRAHHPSVPAQLVDDVFRFAARNVSSFCFGQNIEQIRSRARVVLQNGNDVNELLFLVADLAFLARFNGGQVCLLYTSDAADE